MTPLAPSSPILPPFLPLFLVALAVRFGTVVLGVLLTMLPPRVLPPDDPAAVEVRERIQSSSANVIEPWFRWDAVWMVNIAKHGYSGAEDRGGKLGAAFMPAMPATLAAGEAIGLNPFWFALIVGNLASAIGSALLAQVATRLLNDSAAGWRTLALLSAFPTAFFCSAPYNESFGLLFTAIALAAWQANRPVVSGLGALGGSLARLTGVALGGAAILDWLVNRDRRTLWRAISVTIGTVAGVAIFWGFLWWAVGDPLAGLKLHGVWGRAELSWKNPFRAVQSIYDPNLPHWGEAVVVFGFTVLGVRSWWKRGTFWGVLTLVPVAQMLASGTLLSGHRVVLASLPAFIELADLLNHPSLPRSTQTLLLFVVVVVFALAQLILLHRYVHWQFAG